MKNKLNYFDEKTIEALKPFHSVLENMPKEAFQILVNGLFKMKQFGVSDFGYRTIDKDGYSGVFSTSYNWSLIKQDEEFLQDIRYHMNREINYVKDHNLQIVIRSPEKHCNRYLQKLNNNDINSSVIQYYIDNDRISMYYFMHDSFEMYNQDIILNQLSNLRHIIAQLLFSLNFIEKSQAFNEHKQYIIDSLVLKKAFRNQFISNENNKKKVKIILNKKEFYFTWKELRYLDLILSNYSNLEIANILHVTEHTVKDYIFKLKHKLKVHFKSDLISVLNENNFKRIIEILSDK